MKMKNLKVDELLQEKESLFSEASAIVTKAREGNRLMTDEEMSQYDAKIKERDSVIKNLEVLSKNEIMAKENIKFEKPETKVVKGAEKSLKDRFNEQFAKFKVGELSQFSMDLVTRKENQPEKYADPLLSTTNTTAQTRTIEPGVSILQNDALAIAQQMGVRTPVLASDAGEKIFVSHVGFTGSSVAEQQGLSSANWSPLTLSMKPHRIGLTQTITYEELALLPNDVYSELVAPLQGACYIKALAELFVNFTIDASDRDIEMNTTKYSNKDFTDMKAAVPYSSLKSPVFVTTPAVESYLRNKIIGTVDTSTISVSVGGVVWGNDNKIAGTPVYGLSQAVALYAYYFDANETVLAQWGDLKTIIDTVTDASSGKVRITTFGMFDTGVINKYAVSYIEDGAV